MRNKPWPPNQFLPHVPSLSSCLISLGDLRVVSRRKPFSLQVVSDTVFDQSTRKVVRIVTRNTGSKLYCLEVYVTPLSHNSERYNGKFVSWLISPWLFLSPHWPLAFLSNFPIQSLPLPPSFSLVLLSLPHLSFSIHYRDLYPVSDLLGREWFTALAWFSCLQVVLMLLVGYLKPETHNSIKI